MSYGEGITLPVEISSIIFERLESYIVRVKYCKVDVGNVRFIRYKVVLADGTYINCGSIDNIINCRHIRSERRLSTLLLHECYFALTKELFERLERKGVTLKEEIHQDEVCKVVCNN